MLQLISNASPLIFLAKLNLLELLSDYQIIIPSIVLEELLAKECIEKDRLQDFLSWKNVSTVALREIRAFSKVLGDGELAVIQVALDKKISLVLLDDRRARSLARILKLQPRGTLWVLMQAFYQKKIEKKQLRMYLFDLIAKGFRIDEKLLAAILQKLE